MRARKFAAAGSALAAALGLWWTWGLLAAKDPRLILERRVDLPITGWSFPAVALFLAASVMILAAFLALRLTLRNKGRTGAAADAVFVLALIGIALKSLRLHAPGLSYAILALAFLGTALAAAGWLSPGSLRRSASRASKRLALAALIAAAGLEVVAVLFFVPWSLRGELPERRLRYYAGPLLDPILFADLKGHVHAGGAEGGSLRGIRLEGADLRGAVLKGADLRSARLDGARLDEADLEAADLRQAVLVRTRLNFVNLRNAGLSGAVFGQAYSMGADLRGADFKGSNPHAFYYADGRGMDLTDAKMIRAQFFGSDLREATLRNTDLSDASLIRVRFDDADLSGASLAGADLDHAEFYGARLDGTDLSGVRYLRPESLAEARSLRAAVIDPPLLERLKRINPLLFPDEE